MSDGSDYPAILTEIAAVIGEELCSQGVGAERAADLGHVVAEHLRVHWSGQNIYFPKGVAYELGVRDLQIWREFNSHNHATLARKYQLTEMRIYQIIKRARALEVRRRQPDLFPAREAGR